MQEGTPKGRFAKKIPGHALHKIKTKTSGASPLVSSQERRAFFVPLIKRWSKRFSFFDGFGWDFARSCF